MIPIAFDTETALIRPALLAPPMVCLTWQQAFEGPQIAHVSDAHTWLKTWLEDRASLLVGHFAAYDMAVICAEFPDLIPLVFAAYKAGRVTCTKKRQQLLDIAGGMFRGRIGEAGRWVTHEYTLEALSRKHLGRPMQKDGWRLMYAEFRDVPLAKWPAKAAEIQERARQRYAEEDMVWARRTTMAPSDPRAVENRNLKALIDDVPEGVINYPLNDAATTLGVYLSQEKHAEHLSDQYRQAYADFVLYLSSCWGLRTNAEGVEALEAELREAHDELEEELQAFGLVRSDGTRDLKAVKRLMISTCKANGVPVRRTDAHLSCQLGDDACEEHVSLDADACEAALVGDHVGPLVQYAEFVAQTKMLSNDVAMLKGGTEYPVHTRYDIAETGRTTSSKPNIQNLNTGRIKNNKSTAQRLRPAVRHAFVPRPGYIFAQADFPQLELYTLAQCCYSWLGVSALGDALNAGRDPHLDVAATIVGISYEEAAANKDRHDVDMARQVGKVFNFGKPGGLGDTKLIMFARKTYGVELTPKQCKEYTEHWHETFPEMQKYFARIHKMFGRDDNRVTVKSLFTERERGGATYCAACNNGFQGLGSDCAKAALCLVAEAEYCDTKSPLFGSRTVAFVHDELIVETPDTANRHDAAAAAEELARLMVEGANRYLPDVPIQLAKMKPVLMRAWSKGAKQQWRNGVLVPWEP